MAEKGTSIWVTKKTKERLKNINTGKKTFDEIINDLIDVHEGKLTFKVIKEETGKYNKKT